MISPFVMFDSRLTLAKLGFASVALVVFPPSALFGCSAAFRCLAFSLWAGFLAAEVPDRSIVSTFAASTHRRSLLALRVWLVDGTRMAFTSLPDVWGVLTLWGANQHLCLLAVTNSGPENKSLSVYRLTGSVIRSARISTLLL